MEIVLPNPILHVVKVCTIEEAYCVPFEYEVKALCLLATSDTPPNHLSAAHKVLTELLHEVEGCYIATRILGDCRNRANREGGLPLPCALLPLAANKAIVHETVGI